MSHNVLWVSNPVYIGFMTRIISSLAFNRHYDVISAPADGWTSNPFTLVGRNGYLYGRGATDNKGPIIAVACAAADLLSRRALEVDLVFLVEGEEENGSIGFKDAVQRHKVCLLSCCRVESADPLADIDWRYRCHPCQVRSFVHISDALSNSFLSNSTWIDDNQPCITYGLRGVIRCTLEVSRQFDFEITSDHYQFF